MSPVVPPLANDKTGVVVVVLSTLIYESLDVTLLTAVLLIVISLFEEVSPIGDTGTSLTKSVKPKLSIKLRSTLGALFDDDIVYV